MEIVEKSNQQLWDRLNDVKDEVTNQVMSLDKKLDSVTAQLLAEFSAKIAEIAPPKPKPKRAAPKDAAEGATSMMPPPPPPPKLGGPAPPPPPPPPSGQKTTIKKATQKKKEDAKQEEVDVSSLPGTVPSGSDVPVKESKEEEI